MSAGTIDDLAGWLVEREERYGGTVRYTDVAGGDRMENHGYAEPYAEVLSEFVEEHGPPSVFVEVGILRGTGLAIWCDLFPQATVIGLDINTERARDFLPEIMRVGGFRLRVPEIHTFDQAAPDFAFLDGRKVDVVIDDASHIDDLTLRTLDAFLPHMAEHCLYFVEDQPRVSDIHRKLERNPRGLECRKIHRSLTVLSR